MNIALRSVEELLTADRLVNAHLEVQDRYREAALVLFRLPKVAEDNYLSSGNRCSWPQTVSDWHAYGYSRARMPKIPPQPQQIDRMEELLEWHSWLATKNGQIANIVWRRFAERWRTKVIAHRYGIHRQTVRFMAKEGVQKIVEQYYT